MVGGHSERDAGADAGLKGNFMVRPMDLDKKIRTGLEQLANKNTRGSKTCRIGHRTIDIGSCSQRPKRGLPKL